MKFTILINQKSVIESGLNLDLVDLCIFDFIKDFSLAQVCKKKQEGDIMYFLISWKLIAKQLPLLQITTRQGVFKRMQKLVEADIFKPHPDNQVLGESWYCISTKFHSLVYDPDNDGQQGCQQPVSLPVNNGIHNKTILDNTISNKENRHVSHAAPITIQKKIEVPIRDRKIQMMKLVIDWVSSNTEVIYPKLMYVDFIKYWTEPSMKKKVTKLRFEDQQFFDIGRRLSTWFSKVKDTTATEYWEKEAKLPTINELFKKLL